MVSSSSNQRSNKKKSDDGQSQQENDQDNRNSDTTASDNTRSSRVLADKGEAAEGDDDVMSIPDGQSVSSFKAAHNKPGQLRRGNRQTGQEEVRPGAYHQAGVQRRGSAHSREQPSVEEENNIMVPPQPPSEVNSPESALEVGSSSDLLIMATLVEDRPEIPVVQATKIIEALRDEEADDSSIPGNDNDDADEYTDEDKYLQEAQSRRRRRCWYIAAGVILVAAIAGGLGGAMAVMGGGGNSSSSEQAQSQSNNNPTSAPTFAPTNPVIPTLQPSSQGTLAFDDQAWFDQFTRVSFHSMVYESEISHCGFIANSQDDDPEIVLSCSGENASILLVEESSEGQMDCSRVSSDQIVCSLINYEENDEFVDHWLIIVACGTNDALPSQEIFDQGDTMTFHVDTSIIVAEGCAGEAVDQSQQISGQVTTYEADGYHEVTLGHFCFEQNVEDPDVTFLFEDTVLLDDDCVAVELCTDPDDPESCSGSLCNLELDDLQVQDAIDRTCFLIKQDGDSDFDFDIEVMQQAVDIALAAGSTNSSQTSPPSNNPSESPSKSPIAPTSPNTPSSPMPTSKPSSSPSTKPSSSPSALPSSESTTSNPSSVPSTPPINLPPLSATDPAWYDRYERISFHAVEYESSTFDACSSVEADEPDHVIPEIYLECVEENSSIILAYESSEGELDCWRNSESTVGCTLENPNDGLHVDYLLVLVACGTNDALPSQSDHDAGNSMTFLPYISYLVATECDGDVILEENVDGFEETTYEATAFQGAAVGEYCFQQGVENPTFTLALTHNVTQSSSCEAVESCEDPFDPDTCIGESFCDIFLNGISTSDNPDLDCFMIKQEGQEDFNVDIDAMVQEIQNSR